MYEEIITILKQNGIDPSVPVAAYTSGQINSVYRIGEEYVVKIEKDLDVVAHQPELMQRAFEAGAKVPEILDVGKIDGGDYLFMRLLPGRTIAEDWFALRKIEQESLIEQLAEQLKILHGISFPTYAIPRPKEFKAWREAIREYTDFSGIDLDSLEQSVRQNFEMVKDFYFAHEAILDDSEPPVLVHNDIHFENILHDEGKLTGLIDFDFARQAPKDYELWHTIDFFECPKYYVDEQLQAVWGKFVLSDELFWLRKYYPELFRGAELATRQRLYVTENIISTLRDGWTNKFNEKVNVYFRTDWLERVLGGTD